MSSETKNRSKKGWRPWHAFHPIQRTEAHYILLAMVLSYILIRCTSLFAIIFSHRNPLKILNQLFESCMVSVWPHATRRLFEVKKVFVQRVQQVMDWGNIWLNLDWVQSAKTDYKSNSLIGHSKAAFNINCYVVTHSKMMWYCTRHSNKTDLSLPLLWVLFYFDVTWAFRRIKSSATLLLPTYF